MKYGSKHPRGAILFAHHAFGWCGSGYGGKGHNTKYMAFFPALKAMCGAEKRNEVGGKKPLSKLSRPTPLPSPLPTGSSFSSSLLST